MTYGCGAYICVTCYPYTYRCENCEQEFGEPIPNGQIVECQWCGYKEAELC